MDMNEEQRSELARRIRSERMGQYGTQKAAYIAAGINSSTWAKAEDGEPLAERSLIAIVKLLWPETGGDWQRLDPPLSEPDLEQMILDGPWSEELKDYMLRLVHEDRERAESDHPDIG